MSAHGPDLTSIIASTPRTVPPKVKTLVLVAIVLGVIATGYGFGTAPDRTRTAFVTNFMYFAGICQGAFMLAVVFTVTLARWGRPLKRIAEAFGMFMPVLWLLLMIFLVTGGLDIYLWTHEEMPPHKAVWLQPGFFVARQAFNLGLLILLSALYVRASLRSDLGVIASQVGDRAPAWWGRLTANWQGEEAEVKACFDRQSRLAPVIIILYSIVYSLMAVDMAMSLAPYWYANMFPAWYFMSCFWSGMVAIGMYSLLARDWLGLKSLLTGQVYHDLGKLTFALCMFWGYTTLAQYLAIWYGNMTEEIGFILLRTSVEPWATVSKVVLLTCFLVPWGVLLSRGLKKIPSAYLSITTVIAIGLWLERYLVVTPSVWKEDTLPLGFIEIGMALGLLGAMVGFVTWFLSRVPPVTITDPWMQPHPDDVHVHPSDAHAA